MFDILKYVKDSLQKKNIATNGKKVKRSSKWRKVRKIHLKDNPRCAVCGLKTKVEVHHAVPFSVDPTLELEPKNLITLCENKKWGINCHLLVGHRSNYRNFNPSIKTTIAYMRAYVDKL